MSLREEIEANYRRFESDWKQSLSNSIAITGELELDPTFLESYYRLTTLQAWRAGLLEALLPKESYYFYLEAQNDALVSHIQARSGSWRSALKSLRSVIENVLFALYYMDHPVELSLWGWESSESRFRSFRSTLRTTPISITCRTQSQASVCLGRNMRNCPKRFMHLRAIFG